MGRRTVASEPSPDSVLARHALPIAAPVPNRLGHVRHADGGAAREIGDGPRDAQDAVGGAGTELQPLHGACGRRSRGASRATSTGRPMLSNSGDAALQ